MSNLDSRMRTVFYIEPKLEQSPGNPDTGGAYVAR